MTEHGIIPDVLSADRAYLVDGDMSRQPCVFYFRKSIGDDFDTQVLRCLQYARRQGLRLDITMGTAGVYYDEDKSGSKNIERPGYRLLMSDIMSGNLAGRIVVVRDQDRLSRRESSILEEYHMVTELSKVRTFESSGREIKDDVTTGVMAVINRFESKIIAHRQRARKELRAIQGLPPASRIRRTGYTRGYTAINWEEAKMLRRARSKVVAGQSLWSIAKEFEQKGIVKESGERYRMSDLSRLLRDPVYAALRTFTRDIEVEGKVIPKGTPVTKGKWPQIFTEAEHYEVVEVLSKNKSWSTSSARTYLLTGILFCAECGTSLGHGMKYGKPAKDGTRNRRDGYQCEPDRGGCGRVFRNMKILDDFFVRLTYEAIQKLPVAAPEKVVDTTADEIARQQSKISAAVEAFKDDRIDIAALADIRQDAQKKIATLKKNQVVKPQPLLIDDAEDFLRCEDIGKRRDTIRRFFPIVGVKHVGRGVRFRPDQLVFPESG